VLPCGIQRRESVSRFSWLAVMSRNVKFVGARLRRKSRPAPRIARVAQGDEIYALDDPAILHVQTGNHPKFQHTNPFRLLRWQGLQANIAQQ